MKYNLNQLKKQLSIIQSPERFQHSIGVMYTCSALAMKYEEDLEKSMVAGLLHDCGKRLDCPVSKMINLCGQFQLSISESEYQSPFLLHAKLGAYYAQHEFEVEDHDILHSILAHNTTEKTMNQLDKIVYVADYIEPGRRQTKRMNLIRYTAFVNLDEAMMMILSDTLNYLKDKHFKIDPRTEYTYQHYWNLSKNQSDSVSTNLSLQEEK